MCLWPSGIVIASEQQVRCGVASASQGKNIVCLLFFCSLSLSLSVSPPLSLPPSLSPSLPLSPSCFMLDLSISLLPPWAQRDFRLWSMQHPPEMFFSDNLKINLEHLEYLRYAVAICCLGTIILPMQLYMPRFFSETCVSMR